MILDLLVKDQLNDLESTVFRFLFAIIKSSPKANVAGDVLKILLDFFAILFFVFFLQDPKKKEIIESIHEVFAQK